MPLNQILKPEHFLLWWFFALGWSILVIVASIFYRIRKGKPIFRPGIYNAIFSERWRSGRSLKNLFTRLGGAQNCLWVDVTEKELFVGLHFPFTLMFLPEIYGLEYRIAGPEIVAIDEHSSFLLGRRARVRFRTLSGGDEKFEVSLKDLDGFRRSIERLRGIGNTT